MNLIDSMEAAGISQFPKTRREELLIEFFQASTSEAEYLKTEAEDASLESEVELLKTKIADLETERDKLEDKNNELMLTALVS